MMIPFAAGGKAGAAAAAHLRALDLLDDAFRRHAEGLAHRRVAAGALVAGDVERLAAGLDV
jgi:hypothetical protein